MEMKKYLALITLTWMLVINFAMAGSVNIYTDPTHRYIKSDGLPNHSHGQFPNRSNPNAISAQSYNFKVSLTPRITSDTTTLRNSQYFGVALNGVPFDPGTEEYWKGDRNWRYEALSETIDLGLDNNNAHVQPNGGYHYHGLPKQLIGMLDKGSRFILVGWAADGFPIYYDAEQKHQSSYQLKQGQRQDGPGGSYDGQFVQDYSYIANSGDLDECNGTFAKTNEFPDGTYLYVLTKTFPTIPRCFKGRPDNSFVKARPEQDGRGRGHPPHPRGHRPPPRHHSLLYKFYGYTKVI